MEKILIIDDFEAVRKVITRIVEREKFIAIQACDGKEGLEVFERERPEVIITDLKMPNIDGKGVLCAIKRHHPETEVIVLTGYGDNETADFLIKNGAFSYLKKPLDLQQLVKTLADVRAKIRKSGAKPSAPAGPTQLCAGGDSVAVNFTSDGKIKVVWAGESRSAAREVLEAGADSLALPILVMDSSHQIQYANRAFKKRLGETTPLFDENVIARLRAQGARLATARDFSTAIRQLLRAPGDPAGGNPDCNSLGDVVIFKVLIETERGDEPMLVVSFPTLMS